MKRVGLFLITAITLIGCGDWVSYPSNDLDGIWEFSSQFVRNDCRGMVATSGTAHIEYEEGESVMSLWGLWGQDGDIPSAWPNEPLVGTYDSTEGTFSISYSNSKGKPAIWEGRMEGANNLTGTRKSKSGCYYEISWTAKKIIIVSTPY